MFDEEEISNITRESFGKTLLEDLKRDLRANPFSFCVDASTVGGENILAIKVRYVDDSDPNDSLKNRFFGIKPLEDSSTGEIIFNVLKEKLFTEKAIEDNFIGIAHDHASSLSSLKKGLVGRLKDLKSNFLDLKDPCHSLNLTLKNSFKILPVKIREFITSIHKHFKNSPQRKSIFKKIQIERNMSPLLLKQYVKTRWLSLGESLQRLLLLWDVLKQYMQIYKKDVLIEEEGIEEKEEEDESDDDDGEDIDVGKTLNCSELYERLSDKVFRIQIAFLNYIVRKINIYNIRFQDPTLSIADLKTEIFACYEDISSQIVCPDLMNQSNLDERLKLKWKVYRVKNKWFLKDEDFIANAFNKLEYFGVLEKLSKQEKEEFCRCFKDFLANILHYLQYYFPFHDSLLNSIDFLQLNDGPDFSFIQKVKSFNNYFNLLGENKKEELENELVKLSQKATKYLVMKANSIEPKMTFEDIWRMIEHNDSLKNIAFLARAARALPISSAPIEQSFSIVNLIKTDKKCQLSSESLEALLMVHDHFSKKEIKITEEMLIQFDLVKSELNGRKSLKRNYRKLKSVVFRSQDVNGEEEIIEAENNTKEVKLS